MLHDKTLSPFLSSRKGNGVCWVVGFGYSEVSLTFMGQGCMCICACMWTCVGPSMCVHMWGMCACVGLRMCVHVCMWTCVRLRTCVHVCVWACVRLRTCAHVCVWLVLDPGPRSCEGRREQTLCSQVHQFLTAAEWCSWWKRERRKHHFHFSPGLGPTCLAQSQQKSLKSRFGLINVSRSSAQMGFDSQEEAQLGCFHYQSATGKGLSLRVRTIPQVPTWSFDDHCLSHWAIINTQKLCSPLWALPHAMGAISLLQKGRTGVRAESRHPWLSRWQALYKTRHPKLILTTALPSCPFWR